MLQCISQKLLCKLQCRWWWMTQWATWLLDKYVTVFFAFFALCCIVSSFCSIYSPLSSKMFLIGNYWKQLLNAHCLQKLDYTFTFEVIVVDDGSTDKTTKVCCMYLLLVDVYLSNCDSSVFSETMLSYWLGIGKDIVLYKNTCKQSGMVSFWRWSMQLWSMEK